MSYVHRCMIVPVAQVELARELVVLLAGDPAKDMYTTGLSADGDEPFTHYISSGMIEDQFAQVLADGAVMSSMCIANGREITPLECTALLTACDISDEQPFIALDRLVLKMLTAEELAALQVEKAAKNNKSSLQL